MSDARPHPLSPYDAVVVQSFGGPESPEEVMPFLRRVTAGRGVPDARLEVVARAYHARGGRSPINDQNRALVAALCAELARRACPLPVVLGNRNSPPWLADALRVAHAGGARRVVVIPTSAYSSYSSCRQYREDLAAAVDGLDGLVVDKVRPYAVHPGFVETMVRYVREAVDGIPAADLARARLLFVTHSLPEAMSQTSGPGDGDGDLYLDQHLRVAAACAAGLADPGLAGSWELVFCSRSGSPHQPWLGPDVGERVRELAADGVRTLVLAPVGFVSDHMEVVHDLDTEAAATAAECGVRVVRVATAGTDAGFVAGLVDLLEERAAQARGEDPPLASGVEGDVRPSVCDSGCCPNLRHHLPALCGKD